MNRNCSAFSLCALLVGATMTASAASLVSGIERQYIDPIVRVEDDFYQHVNGKWLANTPIPADKGRYGSFDKLGDDTLDQLRGIVESLQQAASPDTEQRKIIDLYSGFLDEPGIEHRGATPLQADFARIEAVKSKQQIPALLAQLGRAGINVPVASDVHQDAKDSTRYVFDISQGGLGMPDRDYYLQDETRLKSVRDKYLAHIQTMFELGGSRTAAQDARNILQLETALARAQWSRVENRDPVKTYNRYDLDKLQALAAQFNWPDYLQAAGVQGKTTYLIVSQPSYFTNLGQLIQETPLSTWKTYLRWHVLSDSAPYLSQAYVDEHFSFYGTTLRGIEQNRLRWKRGISLVESCLGESLGKLYVEKYFPPQAKHRIDELVSNLMAAYRADIHTLDWMGAETRKRAEEKLAKFTTKIGYPDKWRDYRRLRIIRDDVLGNLRRAHEFQYAHDLAKLGKPVDRNEWDMTPQTVNAYYNPEKNEIVFPAAILQPPFFNAQADDAVNYGGIGAVIGHEISHGFDDQGSQYDGNGNLLGVPGWFTQEDLENFRARTHALVEQYAAYSPVPGFPINGELTLGENIADNAGLAIAYKAYQLSLGGTVAPVIDGLSGDQRFYYGWAEVWRGNARDNELIVRLKSDPHSPEFIRGRVPETNLASFYAAFGIKEGDKMYRPPDKRVSLW